MLCGLDMNKSQSLTYQVNLSRTGAVRELVDVESINLSSRKGDWLHSLALMKVDRPANGSREVYTRAELNRTGGGGEIGGVRVVRQEGWSCVFKGDREDESVLDKGDGRGDRGKGY